MRGLYDQIKSGASLVTKTCLASIVALAAIGSGCVAVLNEDSALTAVPYHIRDSYRITVEVMVNDHGPFDFVLDTGASISAVFDHAFEKTGIRNLEANPILVHGMVGSGIFPVAIADTIQVGSETWGNVRVASLPGNTPASSGIDGILGADFLERYAVVFSVDENVIRLFAPEQVHERSYQGWASIPLRQLRIGEGDVAVYAVELEIGSTIIPALLDLGADLNVMNWRAARSIGVRPVTPRKEGSMSGAVGSAPIVAELVVKQMKIADVQWRDETFLISDSPVFLILDLGDRPLAIVGAGLFSDRDFMIDLERDRMLIRVANKKVAEREGFEPSKGF